MSRLFPNRLLRLGSIYAVGSLATNAVGILLIPLYTAFLTPADYGAVALLTLTAAVLTRGVSAAGFHALSRFYFAPENAGRRGQLVFNLFVLMLLASLGIAAAYVVSSQVLARLLLGGGDWLPLVRLFALVVLFTPVGDFCRSYLRLRERAGWVVGLGLAGVLAGAVCAAVLLVRFDAGVYAMGAAAVISPAVFTAGALALMARDFTWRLSRAVVREPLRYGFSLFFEGYANLLMHLGDRYLLRIFSPLGSVGLYSFGYRFAQVFHQSYVEPSCQATLPSIMKEEGFAERQSAVIRQSTVWYLGLGVIAVSAMTLFCREVVALLATRESFHPAAPILPLVGWGYLLHGLSNFLSYPILMRRKGGTRTVLMTTAAAINILLNLLLIPVFGFLGAAAATLLSYALLCLGAAWLSHRLGAPLPVSWRALLGLCLAAALAGGGYFALPQGFAPSSLAVKFALLAGIALLSGWCVVGTVSDSED